MKTVGTLFSLAVLLMVSLGSAVAAEDYLANYQAAVSDYYNISLDAVQSAYDAGLPAEELPIVFFMADRCKAEPGGLVSSRLSGKSWMSIARENGIDASRIYVHTADSPRGQRFETAYGKFENLTRDEYRSVELTDDDIICLVNLDFLYHHYNYSQRVIMVWSAEGKEFTEVNQLVYAATSSMQSQSLAEKE